MNPDYILWSTFGSLLVLLICAYFLDPYSSSNAIVRPIGLVAAIVFCFSIFMGLAAATRIVDTEPHNIRITKADDLVVIQAVVRGREVVKTNDTTFFFNNITNPKYKIVHREVLTPYYILMASDFILVERE